MFINFLWIKLSTIGSGTCKAGFGGEDAPRVEIPNIIGKPRKNEDQKEIETSSMAERRRQRKMKEYYVGSEAQSNRGTERIPLEV